MKKMLTCAISILLIFALTACDGAKNMITAGGTTVSAPASDEGKFPETSSVTTSEATVSTPETEPEAPASGPSVGHGIFDGSTLGQIWDKVKDNLKASTGFDVNVLSETDYAIGGEGGREEQSLHILLNANQDAYSFAVEGEAKHTTPEFSYTEKSYQAFKDGWFYQKNSTDRTGEAEQSSARIAVDKDGLADQGLDIETILALNAMVSLGLFAIDGEKLNDYFDHVEYIELEGGRSQIVCSGLRADMLLELLIGLVGDSELFDGIGAQELALYGALLAGFAELVEGSVELTIGAKGLPESVKASVSLEISDQPALSFHSDHLLTVNALGSDVGKVILPAETADYPEYKSFEDYLKDAVVDLQAN